MNNKNLSIIGILIISVGAFFGFGAVFSYLETGVGVQALTAAFGALFIILSTNFLMEAQNASSLKREKNVRVFDESLKVYKEAVKSILHILEDSEITLQEVKKLRDNLYSQTILLGSPETVAILHKFIDYTLDLFEENLNNSAEGNKSEKASIYLKDLDQVQFDKLWELAVAFLVEARQSMGLDDYYKESVKAETVQKAFVKLSTHLSEVEKKIVRESITVEDFIEIKNISSHSENLKNLIGLLRDICSLEAKCTKSLISFKSIDRNSSVIRNILYLNVTKKGSFKFSFFGWPDDTQGDFWNKLENKLEVLKPRITKGPSKSKEWKFHFGLAFDLVEEQINLLSLKDFLLKSNKGDLK